MFLITQKGEKEVCSSDGGKPFKIYSSRKEKRQVHFKLKFLVGVILAWLVWITLRLLVGSKLELIVGIKLELEL